MNIESSGFSPAAQDQYAWLGTDPIPAEAYYDADWFEAERQAIFMKTWMVIGHVCELPEPGSFIRRDLEYAKASLLITRGKDGVIRAFHNVCTHRATRLVDEPSGKAPSFVCPYHMWNFGLDGKLMAAPEFERFHTTKEACALKQVACDVAAGLIFINLAREPEQTLPEFLGPMREMMETITVARATTFAEYVYEIDANWKMTYDNFQENYHLRFIHPDTALAGIDPERNAYGYPEAYSFHGPHRTQTIWQNPVPRIKPIQGTIFGVGARLAMADGVGGGEHDRKYFAVFPSFFMLGQPLQNFSHVVYPISATRSRGVIRIYFEGDDDTASRRFFREATLAIVRDIHTEDVDVIRRGQEGLNSGALDVMHFQDMEALCRHLYLQVKDKVDAWRAARAGDAK